MAAKGLKRVSPGVYHNKKGKLVDSKGKPIRLPKNTHTINKRQPKQDKQTKQPEVRGREVSISNSAAERQIVYGEMTIGGVYSYLNANGNLFHMVITIAGHEIYTVHAVYLDHKELIMGASPDPRWATGIVPYDLSIFAPLGDYVTPPIIPDRRVADKVFWAFMDGDVDQPVQPDLFAQSELLFQDGQRWTADCRQRGCALLYMILLFNNDVFPDGVPDISCRVSGKKVYNPLDGACVVDDPSTWVFSHNAALIIADFLRDSMFGLGVHHSKIDWTNIGEAATTCGELVPLANGSSELRYTINGAFDSNHSPNDVLSEMAAAIGGDIVCQVGMWRVFPAKWREPVMDFTLDDARGPLSVVTKVSKKDIFNQVKGKYISRAAGFQPADFPPIKNSFYVSQDGVEIWKDLTFNFVTSAATAQRLAKIELERIRQGIAVSFKTTIKALKLLPTDTVTLTIPRYGWVAKPFEVKDVSLDYADDQGYTVTLALIETASGIFDWHSGEETTVDLAPNTSLPSPFIVIDPTNLALESGTNALYLRGDGTVVSRIHVTWDAPSDDFVLSGGLMHIQYRRSEDASWLDLSPVTGETEQTYIYDVQDGSYYDVRIRSENALGISSKNWISVLNHKVIGKSEPPSDVQGFQATLSPYLIKLSWSAVTDLDLAEYEITVGNTYATSTLVDRTKATSYSISGRASGTYKYWIKAIDTSRNYSLNPTLATIVIPPPGVPLASFRLDGADCVLSWTVPTSFFALSEYEIRVGEDFSTATVFQTTKSTSVRLRVTWLGNRTFWVVARDISGNLSEGAEVLVTISPPDPVRDLTLQVVDNNVFATWTAPAITSLPIDRYKVYRGANFNGSVLLGESNGTFHAIIETRAGQFTYWVQAVDTAGNVSVEKGRTTLVTEPPDFVLKTDQAIVPEDASVLDSIYIEGLGFLIPLASVTIGVPLARRTGLLLMLRV